MKVLTATQRTQGDRPGDFCWTVNGELVRLPQVICAKDQDDPDGPCGCGRAFSGLASSKATTTAEVADLDLTREQYTAALSASLRREGWVKDETGQHNLVQADELLSIAEEFPVGAVRGALILAARPATLRRVGGTPSETSHDHDRDHLLRRARPDPRPRKDGDQCPRSTCAV